VSAENQNPSSPEGGGPDGATEPSNQAPESVRNGVVTSHGEREKRAYVAPVEIPKRHQRQNTIDMSKVRISPDMSIQQVDPRHMPTQKMNIPPGGIRPPPPPATAEIADAQSSRSGAAAASPVAASPAAAAQPGAGASPWSQNAGIDRSMLPSAAMAPAAPAQAARIPSMPPPRSPTSSSVGPGIWIGVVVVAALLGGGVALVLRNNNSSGGTDPVSSNAPIAITVPGSTPTTGSTDSTDEPEVIELDDPEATEDGGAASPSKTRAPRTTPRRTLPATKTTAPAPAPTTTTRPRLFN
jgi:hypothetical protein